MLNLFTRLCPYSLFEFVLIVENNWLFPQRLQTQKMCIMSSSTSRESTCVQQRLWKSEKWGGRREIPGFINMIVAGLDYQMGMAADCPMAPHPKSCSVFEEDGFPAVSAGDDRRLDKHPSYTSYK